ncbi:hypothetical protein NW768_008044 [Fusarium equiseti]|uniref:BTB domain-containing protein n=1 Tax=Fusarium equiseti TaxID=61235 RepID=A0ABQ8R5M5_FUSEQ|nr:hypothetical protein NW768_008044 [Fusarium equiseti]
MDDASIFPFTGEHGTSMSCLLEEGKYSDLTIECGEDSYAVHKAIVCTRSPFFAACCDGDFKEAKSGMIKLPDDDPVAVKMMIRYLYTGTYARPSTSSATGSNGTYWEQWEVHENEYDAKGKRRLGVMGVVFLGNRTLTKIVETGASSSLFGSSSAATFTFGTKPEASANPFAASTPGASVSTGQPQTSANPPAPVAPVTPQVTAQPQVSVNPPAPAVPATNVFVAQAQAPANPPPASAPVAGPTPAQPQYSHYGNQRGRHNSRNRRGNRHSGKQHGNSTHSLVFGATHVTAVPINQTPGSGQAPAPAPTQVPAPTTAPAPAAPAYLPQRKPDFVLHTKIYALGEKYEIKDLKALALQKFAYEATIYHSYHSFCHGAKEAYTCTVDEDRGMRDVVVDTVLKNRYLLDQWSFQQIVKKTDLGFDLLMRLKRATT